MSYTITPNFPIIHEKHFEQKCPFAHKQNFFRGPHAEAKIKGIMMLMTNYV